MDANTMELEMNERHQTLENDTNCCSDDVNESMLNSVLKLKQRVKTRTALLATIFVIAFVLFFLCIVLVVVAFLKTGTNSICLTDGCVKISHYSMSALDTSVDPCDDFYQYACGGWLNTKIVPGNEDRVSRYSESAAEIELQIYDIYHETIQSEDPRLLKEAKRYYQACLNETAIDLEGGDPLIRNFGPIPLLDGTLDSEQLAEYIVSLSYDFALYPSASMPEDFDNIRLQISDGISLYQINSSNHDDVLHWKMMMDKIVKQYNAALDSDDIDRQLNDIINFDAKFVFIKRSSYEYEQTENQSTFLNYTIKELQKSIGNKFNITLYLNHLFNKSGVNYTIDDDAVVYTTLSFFKSITKLLIDTSLETLKNMVWLVMMERHMEDISDDFMWPYLVYKHSLGVFPLLSSSKIIPRWKYCLKRMDFFNDLTDYYYMKEHFTKAQEVLTTNLVKELKTEMYSYIDKQNWMDKYTAEYALEKAKAIKYSIGGPEHRMEWKLLQNMVYREMPSLPENQFLEQNEILLHYFHYRNLLMYVEQEIIAGSVYTSHETNAFYQPDTNEILLLAGILKPPFLFGEEFTPHSFGSLGFIIGHEIFHGFDKNGGKYDKDGNVNSDWWSDVSRKNFDEKAQCLVDQYDQYVLSGVKSGTKTVNGSITLNENIADHGGLRLAYNAFRRWSSALAEDEKKKLPGIDLDYSQRFFLSVAQGWCSKDTEAFQISRSIKDNHSPARYRVIGPLSMFPEFSEAFNCPAGSPMNHPQKCTF